MTHTPIDIEALEADLQRQLDRTRRLPSEPLISISADDYRALIKAAKERDTLSEERNELSKEMLARRDEFAEYRIETQSALASLRALLAEAGEALEPFSYISKQWPAWISDDHHVQGGPNPTVGDLRRAASTLAAIQSALRNASPTTEKPE